MKYLKLNRSGNSSTFVSLAFQSSYVYSECGHIYFGRFVIRLLRCFPARQGFATQNDCKLSKQNAIAEADLLMEKAETDSICI